MRLEGRTALVTGGASGIGAATCRRLAAEGAQVIVADVNLDLAREVAGEVDGEARELDVTAPGAIEGEIDVLVNNAGTDRFGFFTKTDPADWDVVIGVNLRALGGKAAAGGRADAAGAAGDQRGASLQSHGRNL